MRRLGAPDQQADAGHNRDAMTFELRTDRLLLRCPRESDIGPLHERRNDPQVQVLQDWTLPFPLDRCTSIIERAIAAGEPQDDSGWMVTVANAADNEVLGDLFVGMKWGSRAAEIGYTLAREHWGHGYAVEAVTELVRWLFETRGVTRLVGQLHPDNIASAQVLERTGFRFEGHTRGSFWLGDENSDDWLYGMTRDDWQSWNARPATPPAEVRLLEVNESNQHAVRRLAVHKSQDRLVAPVVASMADALFPEIIDGAPVVPWMRAVEADGDLVGFVMVALVTEAHPEPYLWRLLVDRHHQRRGIGDRIVQLVVDELRLTGSTSLLTSWVDGRGSPRAFYERLGFAATGAIVDGEIEGRLTYGTE